LDKDKLTTLLRQASREIGVSLNHPQVEMFWLYLQELLEWNSRFNLTAIGDPEDIIIKHFVDSLTPLRYLAGSGSLLDIGPGAGFPGIPLKIAAPMLNLQLVEANRKKVSFLKHIIRTLGLENVTVLHGRIEEMAHSEKSFEIIISRAFRKLEPLLQLVSPLLKPENTLVAMLGPTTKMEQKSFMAFGLTANLDLIREVSLQLPYGRGSRTLLLFKKRHYET
jgi:16S rRNA (guanine527-N7)-methyltransferase